jgi:hypothetical protein
VVLLSPNGRDGKLIDDHHGECPGSYGESRVCDGRP